MSLNYLQVRSYQWLCKLGSRPDDVHLRARRFLEEAVELVQALGLEKERAQVILDYVYARPVGEVRQEIGGVGMTLLPLCEVLGISAEKVFREELLRVDNPETIERIMAKQAVKQAAGL